MIEKSKFIRELELVSTDKESMEPFHVLIDSLNDEANLGSIGQIAVVYQLKQHINNRILIDKAYSLKKHSVSYDGEWISKCVDQSKRNETAKWDEEGNLLT